MSPRTVRALHPAQREDIGELMTRRPLPGPSLPQLDPFLFLNHHGPQTYPPRNGGLPFGPHPHRGFETVTFILEGELAHADSAGHESVIAAGGVQWMTAGRGIVHAELSPAAFKERGGQLEILQLWINLPARLKMVAPRYVGLQAEAIPAVPSPEGGATVNLIAGAWNGHTGPVAARTGVHMATVALAPGGRVRLPAPRGRTVFLYIVRGTVMVGGTAAAAAHLVELEDDGDGVDIAAAGDALLVFGHAEPIGEPVVAYGPFVMNTEDEIRQAVRDYQSGKLGDLRP